MTNLFNPSDLNTEYLFKQYSMFVSSAEKNSERRTHLNTFFIALYSLFISGLSLIRSEVFVYMIPICGFGCVLALLWLQMLRNYRRLNKAKYSIIQEIESRLPLNLYKTEWDLYINRKHLCNPLKYMSFSRLEMVLPWLLIIVYIYLVIITYYNHV